MSNLSTTRLLKEFIKNIFPLVDEELNIWKLEASACPDRILSSQALSSIEHKSFHAQGGSVFALYPDTNTKALIKLIVAYQTISDYLDNLCDRAGVQDEDAFLNLHLSMLDSLDCTNNVHDYYMHYPYKNDGDYLINLVGECKTHISQLPSFSIVQKDVLEFAKLYCSLQAYKHLPLNIREKKLFDWANLHMHNYPGIMPWEFCAASGSTLGIFILFAIASKPGISAEEVKNIKEAYFPWICGLHILLDYFIDYNEDIKNKDLNFVMYYKDEDEILYRLNYFIKSSIKMISTLKYPVFHKTVIYGLLAMYLSDDKAFSSNLASITEQLLSSQGIKLRLMHRLCKMLRKKQII